ncbi:PAS domain-containing protein [Phaeovulum sp.]|uniref:PAS domain-containing protein n=1 Tax=Phaeovulum sp. TaxID=2934796 RepID=UPI00356487D4
MNESNASTHPANSDKSQPGDVEKRILAGVLSASSDACWCMEFGTPVDLTAPDHEVVRQVFANDPFWRFANPAMAQLYLLDAGQNFTDRPVREIFPRNRQNEEFVLNLLANGFEVDAAPALDRRYDGVEIYVENDVRAHIEGGRLLRIFGIVRDVGKHRRRELALQRRLDAALALLSAVEAPLVALDADQRIQVVNLAAAVAFQRSMDDCLGQAAADLLIPSEASAPNGKRKQLLAAVVAGGAAGNLTDDFGARWSVAPRTGGGAILGPGRDLGGAS